jgi:hypothetical protein
MTAVFELRQYTLHPGKRDVLIELFEREFIEAQEAAGIRLPGLFRDLGDPDRFVWFRGFPDMERRREALTRFYEGPVWKAHRDEANATMIDSDDVLLLRLAPDSDFPKVLPRGTLAATVFSFATPIDDELLDLVRHDAAPLTLLQTEPAENTYTRLPIRTGENVIVSLTSQQSEISKALASRLTGPPQRMTLEPTARSYLCLGQR